MSYITSMIEIMAKNKEGKYVRIETGDMVEWNVLTICPRDLLDIVQSHRYPIINGLDDRIVSGGTTIEKHTGMVQRVTVDGVVLMDFVGRKEVNITHLEACEKLIILNKK